jgi:polar amino acid transport system permease protein
MRAVGYSLEFGWLGAAVELIGRGALTTVFLIVVAALIGTFLSILGAAGRRSAHKPIRAAIAGYVELIRNTPFLAQLFFIYFGLPSLGILLNPVVAAILAMTVNLAAYGTEIVGAGLDAVSRGQREAALALGLKPRQVFVDVVLPQALKVIFPALTSQIVIMMLESSVVSQIAVRELTYEADLLQARTFRAFETYFVVTLVYLGLSVALRQVMNAGGRRLIGGAP